MYPIGDNHIDYILNDLGKNGIKTEALKYSLLDHICCILENKLHPDDDFEACYRKEITNFYSKNLQEIETEASNLIAFKNYYAMKKTMIRAGVVSAILFILGAVSKIFFLPGAA